MAEGARRSNENSSAPQSSGKTEIERAFPPLSRQDVLKWNGWGYRDSGFRVNEKDVVSFAGNRYMIAGRTLPRIIPFMQEKIGLDTELKSFSQPPPTNDDVPKPIRNANFESAVADSCVKLSHDGLDRIMHSHGHTCHELFALRTGKWGRLPDVVIWPKHHQQVVTIVNAAMDNNVCLIPFGGGTNVSGALECPVKETRTICSLDLTAMDKILSIDEKNLTVTVEAGIIGQDMERQLRTKGYTCGHEPDSIEFSSVGGWVATRSSGMKKNIYGNIEDLVVHMRFVTPVGTIEKNFLGPRNSVGPDIHHFIMGSEGTLGVITEVTMRIRPLPPIQRYGSIVFKDFNQGIDFMREVARQRCAPASIRLMDNDQFQMGQALKTNHGMVSSAVDWIKKQYLTKFKRFDVDKLAACTLLLEGTANDVAVQEKTIYSIAAQFGGIQGGSENGRYGYMMTFCVAYVRDLGFDYCFLSESFETSVPWDRVASLIQNVRDRVAREGERHRITFPVVTTARVTQTYDVGACVYFYLVFNYTGISDPLGAFSAIEAAARDEILASGGSLSHHHGDVLVTGATLPYTSNMVFVYFTFGKIRKPWVQESLSEGGVEMLKAVKERIDPKNIFGGDNLLPSNSPQAKL